MSTDVAPEALMTGLGSPSRPLVIDVRRTEVFRAEPVTIPGALRRDPAALAEWSRTLPGDRPLVVYCVHGHKVSRNARDALRRLGFDADLLAGGLDGWKAAGGAVVAAGEGDQQ